MRRTYCDGPVRGSMPAVLRRSGMCKACSIVVVRLMLQSPIDRASAGVNSLPPTFATPVP